jgi:signal transduction histidine kinase
MSERVSAAHAIVDPAGEPAPALVGLVENHPHHAALLWGAPLRCVALSRPLRRYFSEEQSWDPAQAGTFLEEALRDMSRRVLHAGIGEVVTARLLGGPVDGVQLCPAGLGGVVVFLPTLPHTQEQPRAREFASLRAILDALPLPLVVAFGPRGEERMLNVAAKDMLGASERDEAPGESIFAVSARWGKRRGDGSLLPEEARPLRRALRHREVVMGLEVSFSPYSTDTPISSDEDERRVYLESAAPILSRGGELLGAVAVFQEITEQKRADRQKDHFLSVAGRELRTPLTVLRTQTQLISRWLDEMPAEQIRQVAEGIDTQAERLSQLVDDILDVGRLATGKVEVRPQPVDLSQLLRDVAARVGGVDRQRILVLTSGEVLVRGDALRLEQVIENLLTHGLRSSPVGGQLTARAFASSDQGLVSVQDQGPGIPPRDRERIFERFHQVERAPRGDFGGLGLGLWISRKLVELMGGQIWVESPGGGIGAGATFTFQLPLYKEGQR